MSDVIIPYRFLVRGGTAAAVAALNEIPKDRELILETDTGRMKRGNGVTAYNSLPYVGAGLVDLSGLADGDVQTWDAVAGNWVVGPQSGGGGSSPALQFDADTGSTADSDPGPGLLKWNNATQGSATVIFVDDQTSDGVSLTGIWPALKTGGFLFLQHATDPDTWQIWEVTGVTDASGYAKLAVTLLANGGSFADADPMLVTIQNGPATADIAGITHAASSKSTPVDADELPLVDSAASNVLKKLTWANLKATLKAYFDTLYRAFTEPVSALSIASGVVNIDCALGPYYTLSLTANVTSITFSNLPASGFATTLMVRLKQDATGSRTVALPSSFKRTNGSDLAVQSAANAYTILALTSFDQGTRWEYTMAAGSA